MDKTLFLVSPVCAKSLVQNSFHLQQLSVETVVAEVLLYTGQLSRQFIEDGHVL